MQLRAPRTFVVEPSLPTALEPLRPLSRNLHWTWSTDAIALFQRLGRERWEASGHNPVRLLQTMPRDVLDELAGDDSYLAHQGRVFQAMEQYLAGEPKLQIPATSEKEVIAYFSLEFAITESLPIYSGGLGVLAGDHLKSASDLGLPLVGVGLFYRQGYFQQVLAPDGWQTEEYREIDPAQQPLERVLDATGEPISVPVPFPGRDVWAAVWRLQVGRTPLYLLDSDVEQNSPEDRGISARLYGGDLEMRIQQEMLVGIGGIRALRAMGYTPTVCHMNEGHSALLGVERMRLLMEETGLSVEEAALTVTAATVFTTHTAVAAGIDLFPPELVRTYLGDYYNRMGISDHDFLGFGRLDPDDDTEPFSMALLGLRLSGYRNGVSRLHRTVSRRLWAGAWPDLPEDQIPIDSITNGVHLPTWVAREVGDLYDLYVGQDWRDEPVEPEAWAGVAEIPDEALWGARTRQRQRLIQRAREQFKEDRLSRGEGDLELVTGQVLDPNVLTIGFARRFAGYKRATLLFRDPERLARILNNPERPVQFIFAGKAHPRDEPAKQLIREVVAFSRRPEFRDRLVILERYDVELAAALVQGCDVWLNTPLRPLEASGTSGMKAVANGALHMSTKDGWWAEAYRPGLGWKVGRDHVDDDPEVQDAFDAESIYTLLENEVAPLFYNRDADGVPRGWVERIKASIAAFAPEFGTQRMVREYALRSYTPAAEGWAQLRRGDGAAARELAEWMRTIRGNWAEVKVHAVEDDATETQPNEKPVTVLVQAHLGRLQPKDVAVELVHGAATADGELQHAQIARMEFEGQSEDGVCRYRATLTPETGGRVGYVVRLMPNHPDLPNAADMDLVYWA